MKKRMDEAKMEFIRFAADDVITTSAGHVVGNNTSAPTEGGSPTDTTLYKTGIYFGGPGPIQ